MTIIATLLTLIALPGIPLGMMIVKQKSWTVFIPLAGVFGIAWSIAVSFILTLLGAPLVWGTVLLASAAPALVMFACSTRSFSSIQNAVASRIALFRTQRMGVYRLSFVIIMLGIIGFLAVPFLTIHEQLPTGDIQKAIFWATRVTEQRSIPDYSEALLLNRDPADFVTPGLHTLTAAIISLSGNTLTGPAWFAFVGSIILAMLAASIASLIIPSSNRLLHGVLLAFFVASLAPRFLRYAFAPGYHFQNLIGELLLLSAFIVFLLLLSAPRKEKGALFFSAMALVFLTPLVHQFTAFLALFLIPATLLTTGILYWKHIVQFWHSFNARMQKTIYAITTFVFAGIIIIGAASPLREKIPHLFSSDPHYTDIIIPIPEYPSILGIPLVVFGIGGIIAGIRNQSTRRITILLAVWTAVLFLLGQGPHMYVDIPSARTLFYATIPLAACAGMFMMYTTEAIQKLLPTRLRIIAVPLISVMLLAPIAQGAVRELESVTHSGRTQTTITRNLDYTIRSLKDSYQENNNPAILIDDWNRRRLTWTILSPYSMVTRVGGELDRISYSAGQSSIRNNLYENHLDYEKVFMAGNSQFIAPLLLLHNIHFIGTSLRETSSVFSGNPLLEPFHEGDNYTIFIVRFPNALDAMRVLDDETGFLLNRSTLVNDVGDNEDTLPHSAISLLGTHVPDASIVADRPVREIDSAIDLRINIGTYVRPLWDPEEKNVSKSPVRLLVRALGNGTEFTVSAGGADIPVTLPTSDMFQYVVLVFPAENIPIDERGFATISLAPNSGTIILDLVAAGLAE